MTIPIVDITALAQADSDDDGNAHAHTVAAIGRACREHGFLAIVGHGVDPNVIDDAFVAARAFFALPDGVKTLVAMDHDGPGAERGWDGVARQRLDAAAPPDQKESFNVGPPFAADHPLVLAGTPMHGPNRWPDEEFHPGFRAVIERAQQSLGAVARRLLRAMAESLDLPAGYFDELCTTPQGSLRLTHYPGSRSGQAAGTFGAGAHTDWGILTVLAQDSTGGLEVRTADGAWIPAPPVRGALVVNIGDLMERWTNGVFRSTPHRVVLSAHPRQSVVLFHDLDWDAVVAPIPSCVGTGFPAPPEPITVGAHLLDKFAASVVRVA